MWPSWSGYVDPSIGLRYQVEYKLSDYHGGNESGVWRPGPVVENTGSAQQVATVLDLRRNSFYEFRTLPILRVGEQDVRGIISPQSGPFRTKCHGVYFFLLFSFVFVPLLDCNNAFEFYRSLSVVSCCMIYWHCPSQESLHHSPPHGITYFPSTPLRPFLLSEKDMVGWY